MIENEERCARENGRLHMSHSIGGIAKAGITVLGLAIISSLFVIVAVRYGRTSVPITYVELSLSKPMVAIDTWRIIGPFPLLDDSQRDTKAAEDTAFARNYLAGIHGAEAPLRIPPATTRVLVDFTRNSWTVVSANDLSWSKTGQFLDQVQTFPSPAVNSESLFWHTYKTFKVMYAAATLFSAHDVDVALILSGNSPAKLWLNNEVVIQPRPGFVGHEPYAWAVRHIHLHEGPNSVLLKLFCFPVRNDFALRIATVPRAIEYIKEHGGLADVVDEVVIPKGGALTLSDNLWFFSDGHGDHTTVAIYNVRGQIVSSSTVDLVSQRLISTKDLPEGLYSIRVSVGGHEFSEDFYLGDAKNFWEKLKRHCSHYLQSRGDIDPCIIVDPLEQSLPKVNLEPRLDRDKPIVFLISQVEWGREHINATTATASERRFHLIGYRSAVDGQIRYYYIHLPNGYGRSRIPLVLVVPPYEDAGPFLKSPPTNAPDLLHKYAFFADKYNYAVMAPLTVGPHHYSLPTKVVLAELGDVQRRYLIDRKRIYLTGDCAGGRDAILLAERFPDRFAAVSTANAATGDQSEVSGSHWRDASNALLYVQNMERVPLRIVHGDVFPHSPIVQAWALKNECDRHGKDVELIVVPRDGELGERDMMRLEFEFFRDKALSDPPARISFATSQLKYNTDSWISIERMNDPTRIASVDAELVWPNTVEVASTNAARLVLLPEKFAKLFPTSRPLLVQLNGTDRWVTGKGRKAIRLNMPPVSRSVPAKHFRDHEAEGPIFDAFAQRFELIRGTGGKTWEQRESQRLVGEIATAWHDNYFGNCVQMTDRDVTSGVLSGSNLIIVGKIGDNLALKAIRSRIPLALTQNGMRMGGQTIRGDHLIGAIVYPNPVNRHRYVVAIDFNGEGDLPAPDLARSGVYDAMVWATAKNPMIMGQWYWDSSWNHLLRAQE